MKIIYRWLRSMVIRLSGVDLFRHFFRSLYCAQLKIIVTLIQRDPNVRAVLLRRPSVLIDAFPGDSDFDLTIVLKGTAADLSRAVTRCGKRDQWLKTLFPILGETKFVDERDLDSHLRFDWPAYGGELAVLVDSGPHPIRQPRNIPALVFSAKVVALLRDSVLPKIYGAATCRRYPNQVRFLRFLPKDILKMEWLLTRQPAVLNYRGKLPVSTCYLSIADADRRLRDFLSSVPYVSLKAPARPHPFTTQGAGERFSTKQWNRVNAEIAPLIDRWRSVLVEGSVSNFRPYKFNKLFVLKFHDAAVIPPSFYDDLQTVSRRLSQLGLGLATPVINALPAHFGRFARIADPITEILRRHDHYDLLSGAPVSGERQSGILDRAYLEKELIETMVLIHSIARKQDTNYLWDLLFGHLIPFRLMLQTGIFYTSFAELEAHYLNALPKSPTVEAGLDLYRRAELFELDRIPTRQSWRDLSPLIEHELAEARKVFA
jgi:hypothetical protein